MSEPRTEAGRQLVASEGVLPLFIGAAAGNEHVLLDAVSAIEDQARQLALDEVEALIGARMGGGTWHSRTQVLAILAELRRPEIEPPEALQIVIEAARTHARHCSDSALVEAAIEAVYAQGAAR